MSNHTISQEQVKKVGKLARLNLNQAEGEKFAKDLSGILDYFKDISQLKVEKTEVVNFLATESNHVREDIARENDEAEKGRIRNLFPDREDDYLKVKAVL